MPCSMPSSTLYTVHPNLSGSPMTHRALFVFLFLLLPTLLPAQSDRVIDRTIAVVGNEIITQSELDIKVLQMSMRNPKEAKNTPDLRKRLLDGMINEKLVLAQALLDSVSVSEEDVTAQLEGQIRMLEQNYGSRERLEQAAGMSISQIKRELREDIRKNLIVRQMQTQKFGTVAVSHREVEEFFTTYKDSLPQIPEQVELRQLTIYPKVVTEYKTAARLKAQSLLDSLNAGAPFEELARRYSEDTFSAKNGGRLGTARRGQFVKEFEEAAYALKPGEVSEVVETQFGFHVIKLTERKGESITVQHILIKPHVTGAGDSTAIGRLNALRDSARAGADFAVLARRYTEDEATRKTGGSLGLVDVDQLSADVQRAQQDLTPGQVSTPVKVTFEKDYAFAIVQLVRRVPPHRPNLSDDYQKISIMAKNVKQNRLLASWIESIKSNVYWHVVDGSDK